VRRNRRHIDYLSLQSLLFKQTTLSFSSQTDPPVFPTHAPHRRLSLSVACWGALPAAGRRRFCAWVSFVNACLQACVGASFAVTGKSGHAGNSTDDATC
jgi:hypothetical protein